ncbi:methyltransferase [Sinorhizobium meliloti]|uniref:methyltransferase n=1 Tax=Rhizobium meliloti TaxID=382 RepID=UPI0005A55A8F|nr:methyltransferase [Sinorhizobium meliloti]MDE4591119.1 class I SAM-dependent methyltransferase [Sinorhizobium meliloti]
MYVIGAGMRKVEKEYEVCFESGRISVFSDGILKPFVDRAAHLPKVENVAERRAAIKAMQDEAQAVARRQSEEAAARRNSFREEAKARTPSWAKAVIVAELIKDQSDSMTDYFASTTVRTVILGFSSHARDLFPELRKFAAMFEETVALATAPESAEHREKYSMGAGYYLKSGYRNSNGWRIKKHKLYDGAESVPVGEWHIAEKPAAVDTGKAPAAADGVRIEEHTHSKKGFQMHIVILPERVDRAAFDAMNESAKAFGGWYSRPWGKTPGGFAFKARDKAESFVSGLTAATPSETAPAANGAGNATIAERFRAMADKMQSEIDNKLGNRLANTPKRQREAAAARIEGWQLKRTQSALRALADMHESGTVPAILSGLKSKADIHALTRSEIERSNSGYYDAGIDTNRPAVDTEQARAVWALAEGKSESDKQAEILRAKIERLQFTNIPGYFPTPAEIVSDMVAAAGLRDEPCRILEPSAGSGAIVKGIRAVAPQATIQAFERHFSLREILQMQNVELIGNDFTESAPTADFDYVLMNPPFENGQDAEHVQHAFRFLKSGGRLVAIMSPGPFFRSDRKAQAFRDWLDTVPHEKRDLPAGAFKESGTGVATVLLSIDA